MSGCENEMGISQKEDTQSRAKCLCGKIKWAKAKVINISGWENKILKSMR